MQANHMYFNWTSILLSMLLFVACSTENCDKKYFAGDIYTVVDNIQANKMSCDTLKVDGVYQGSVFIYDSLLFYYPINRTAKSSYEIYNLKDQSFIGSFCNKGGGPNEFSSLMTIYQFYKEGEDLKTTLYAMNEGKLVEWNISESICQNQTIHDTIIPYDWMVDEQLTVDEVNNLLYVRNFNSEFLYAYDLNKL